MPRRPSREPDLTPAQVARALGFADVRDFLERARDYHARGLRPDPITGRYDPDGFDRWRRLRNADLFPDLTPNREARDAATGFHDRLSRLGG